MHRLKTALSHIKCRANTSDRFLFCLLFLYRTLNSLLIRTVFEPDEIFQNIEPIPFFLRGRGEPTWDWMLGIRSFNYVLLYLVPSYFAYKAKSMCMAYLVPKMINGLVSSLTDYFTVKIGRLYGVDVLQTTLLSHGLWLYSPRSHINSFEMFVGVTAFYFLTKFRQEISVKEKKRRVSSLRIFMYVMVYGAFLRPSACLLCIAPLARCLGEREFFIQALKLVPEAILFLCVLVTNDTLYYGEFVVAPYNFFKINMLCGVSELFGFQPWYSHFLFAFVLLGAALPVFLLDASKFKGVSATVCVFVAFYSLFGHKEMRFILPIVPFCNIVAAKRLKNVAFLQLAVLAGSVYIGAYFRDVGSSISILQGEIESVDREGGYVQEINVLYCLCPYLMPTYPFFPNERVRIKELGSNPDIYAKIPSPKIYRRFKGRQMLVNEHQEFVSDLRANIASFLDYDIILIHKPYYEEIEDLLNPRFTVRSKVRYFPRPFGRQKCAVVYFLRRTRGESTATKT